MTQELAILNEHLLDALAFLVDRCEVNSRAAIARNPEDSVTRDIDRKTARNCGVI